MKIPRVSITNSPTDLTPADTDTLLRGLLFFLGIPANDHICHFRITSANVSITLGMIKVGVPAPNNAVSVTTKPNGTDSARIGYLSFPRDFNVNERVEEIKEAAAKVNAFRSIKELTSALADAQSKPALLDSSKSEKAALVTISKHATERQVIAPESSLLPADATHVRAPASVSRGYQPVYDDESVKGFLQSLTDLLGESGEISASDFYQFLQKYLGVERTKAGPFLGRVLKGFYTAEKTKGVIDRLNFNRNVIASFLATGIRPNRGLSVRRAAKKQSIPTVFSRADLPAKIKRDLELKASADEAIAREKEISSKLSSKNQELATVKAEVTRLLEDQKKLQDKIIEAQSARVFSDSELLELSNLFQKNK